MPRYKTARPILTEAIMTRLTEDDFRALNELAMREGLYMSQLVRRIIVSYIGAHSMR